MSEVDMKTPYMRQSTSFFIDIPWYIMRWDTQQYYAVTRCHATRDIKSIASLEIRFNGAGHLSKLFKQGDPPTNNKSKLKQIQPKRAETNDTHAP
uniref:AlNc14C202G8731 protein n=1 Tax=Albugo laibachii Nc14 TaxID=890382 RepID=F0WQS1_9STRA|nr:AlNc14C202G8731 [Albugo laibachii Nc14]|eukprot:CCA23680.1 AlNc14C202G8731 [Albugo laibachii Nc14]